MNPPYDDDENEDDERDEVDDAELDWFDNWIREHAYFTTQDQMMIEKFHGK